MHEDLVSTLGPEIGQALARRGFERLTSVQEAVLAPALEGKDLRISSQTGSGKTVAIGFALRAHLGKTPSTEASDEVPAERRRNTAHPRCLIITPTRELAKQVEEELAWLYAGLGAGVVSVAGGHGFRDELRSFSADPAIVVGTPGRLLDHLKRGSIDASSVAAVVLDEADHMLDLGFREDLEATLAFTPSGRRTHLVSATFPREVRALADRIQTEPVVVEGTPLGTANVDIEHLVHLVLPHERFAAIVNLLLETPGAHTLVFARTRAGVAKLAGALQDEGFAIAMLSGEMEQPERNRALAAFKRGQVDALVATDVAARGIDVQDVARVIHAEPPDDADAYTHRSGRTGRAGKKGTSSVLVTTSELQRVTQLLGRARVAYRLAAIPSAAAIRDAREQAMFTELTEDVPGESVDARDLRLAQRLLGSDEPVRAVARLVALANRRAPAEPREITPVEPHTKKAPGPRRPSTQDQGWVRFRVSWGEEHGADARRLVAMMCRRGKIEGRDIGAIRVGRTSSVIEVAAGAAPGFERAMLTPDPRDPRVHVRRAHDEPTHGPTKPRAGRPTKRDGGNAPPKRRGPR